MEEIIKETIKELEIILKKYEELDRKTKGAYHWRVQSISAQIDILRLVLTNEQINMINDWKICYNEDVQEV